MSFITPGKITKKAELDMSREEDSVSSLAATPYTLPNKNPTYTAIGGINSSEADQKSGKNQHLRTFAVTLPTQSTDSEIPDGSAIDLMTKRALFTPSSDVAKDGRYQRLTKVRPSRTTGAPGLAAIATGAFSAGGEIVIFDTDATMAQQSKIRGRIQLEKAEANDLDILEKEDGDFQVVYCTDTEIFLYDVPSETTRTVGTESPASTPAKNRKKGKKTPLPTVASTAISKEPESIYVTRPLRKRDSVSPKLRAIRFLTPSMIMILWNLPNRSGSELVILQRFQSNQGFWKIVLRKRLHHGIGAGTALDTANLPDPKSPKIQVAVAVAGSDNSIEILVLNLAQTPQGPPGRPLAAHGFKPVHLLKDVQKGLITGIKFHNPAPLYPCSPSTPPLYLRLASISVESSVLVHSLPLTPLPMTVPRTKEPHYLLLPERTENSTATIAIIFALIVVVIASVVSQALLELRGGAQPIVYAKHYLPSSWVEKIEVKYDNPWDSPIRKAQMGYFVSFIKGHGHEPDSGKQLIFRDQEQGLAVGVHHAESSEEEKKVIQETHKSFEALTEKEQSHWLKKLKDAGHWVEDEGTSVFKGVLFGEIAGAVAGAFAG
jgi:hypothetical protein